MLLHRPLRFSEYLGDGFLLDQGAWLLFQLRFHRACAHREREGEAGESETDSARERESEREGGESETESARERESERQRERRAMLSGPAGLGSAQG